MTQIKKFFMAFYYATRGILAGMSERNVRFHVGAMVLVLLASWWLGLTQTEWFVVIILIALVISAELVNTAVEDIANHMRDELGLSFGSTTRARDVAAGAVLVIAIAAAIIGLMIFVPKLMAVL